MKKKSFFYLALLGLVGVQFGTVGVLKIVGFAPLYQQLAELHVPREAGLLIGVLEVLGVVGLWVRRTRGAALLGLWLLAIGAMAVHVGAGVAFEKAIPALVATTLLTTLLYWTNPDAARSLLTSPKV